MQKDINFNCPNCKSNKYKSKTTMGKKYNEGPYKDVVAEIQCSTCFMDIPTNISENINIKNLDKFHKLWINSRQSWKSKRRRIFHKKSD